MKIERYHTAYQKAVHDHVLPLMVADGMDTEQAEALLAGMLTVKYEGFADYVRETLNDFAFAVNGENRGYEVIEEMMTADGYSKSQADAFAKGVSYAAFANPGLSCGVDSDDVAKAYAMGYLSNNTKPPTPEQAAELERLKSRFSPQECQEICIEASRSMERLRTAKKLIAQVKTSIIDNGATTEAADAFIEGFMTGDDVSVQ